ncbi:hypothetical protein BFW38_03480 [Terasakiispira papahanaumokuakeensis]|uniref:6-phosphogluconolactonase n=1 Tax=Terasakiispira papahanaumokuakeensis TaxID=197479 RepID=A0A1E2V6Y7_9GAMM|nr:beta-propeller fold lactonase family protein [Terasakiispira papahanaumokuakeensis]ODC02747.1 hypothetical protein BFW38_03480 [Terasakiispira papahanaumokuakeensis]
MPDTPIRLYIGCALSGEIATVLLAPDTGRLTREQRQRLPDLEHTGGAMPMALSHDQQHLYAVSRGTPFFIADYEIAPHGALIHRHSTPIETNLAYLQATPDGRYLLSASYIDHHISIYPIEQDHTVGQAITRIDTAPHAHALSMAPTGQHLLATSIGGDCIYQWQWHPPQTSVMPATPLHHQQQLDLPTGTGPRHITFHPTLPLAYVIGERNGCINVLRYGDAGLALLQTVSMPHPAEAFQAADIHITPDGRWIYASEKAASTLNLFHVDSDGLLNFSQRFHTENRPRGFAITSDGAFLIAAGQFSHHISSYRIDTDNGQLHFTDRLAVGQSPDWIEIHA